MAEQKEIYVPRSHPIPIIESTIAGRRAQLQAALNRVGMPFNENNEIFQQFVFRGVGALYLDVDEIARIAAEDRYLHEYCDYAKGLDLARDQSRGVKLARDQWNRRVRSAVMQLKGIKAFPKPWPWIDHHEQPRPAPEKSPARRLSWRRDR